GRRDPRAAAGGPRPRRDRSPPGGLADDGLAQAEGRRGLGAGAASRPPSPGLWARAAPSSAVKRPFVSRTPQMFMRFFTELRQAKVPVTLKEYLMLMEGLDKAVSDRRVDDFYYLSRAALVTDETNLDRSDQEFGHSL